MSKSRSCNDKQSTVQLPKELRRLLLLRSPSPAIHVLFCYRKKRHRMRNVRPQLQYACVHAADSSVCDMYAACSLRHSCSHLRSKMGAQRQVAKSMLVGWLRVRFWLPGSYVCPGRNGECVPFRPTLFICLFDCVSSTQKHCHLIQHTHKTGSKMMHRMANASATAEAQEDGDDAAAPNSFVSLRKPRASAQVKKRLRVSLLYGMRIVLPTRPKSSFFSFILIPWRCDHLRACIVLSSLCM